jgi:hypothetical protein
MFVEELFNDNLEVESWVNAKENMVPLSGQLNTSNFNF